jgi:ribulose-phosphate 3-epimerase
MREPLGGFPYYIKEVTAMIKIAPSILSADFANLQRDIQKIAQADYVHVDVMDGLFVPNITIGIPVVRDLRKVTGLPLDVHLMIDRPVRYVEDFCKAGADIVTVHVEADSEENTRKALDIIHSQGKKAGVVLKPKTPADAALPFLERCDILLVMTVEPGFGGQSFMPDMMGKVAKLREWIDQKNPACELEVDGGINLDTAKVAVQAGANVLVAGSAVYGAQDIPKRIQELRG